MAHPEGLHVPNMVITTPRLIIRDMNLSDECCFAMYRIRSDPRVLKTVNTVPPKELSGMREWIRERISKPNTFSFIIELRNPKDPSELGTSANIIGSAGGNRTPEFGYSIDANHWGKGYATEALKAILDAFWDTWPNGMSSLPKDERNEARLFVSADNFGSVAVARKCGFSEVGSEPFKGQGTIHGKMVTRYRIERPDGRLDRPRAYEKLEITGPNTCEGAPVDV